MLPPSCCEQIRLPRSGFDLQVPQGACCQSRSMVVRRSTVRGTRAPVHATGTALGRDRSSNRGQARLKREGPNAPPPWPGWGARRWASFLTSYAMARPAPGSAPCLAPDTAPAAARDGPSVRRWPSRPSTRGAPAALGGWRAEIGDDSVAQSHRPGARGCGRPPGPALRLDRARPQTFGRLRSGHRPPRQCARSPWRVRSCPVGHR